MALAVEILLMNYINIYTYNEVAIMFSSLHRGPVGSIGPVDGEVSL